MPINKKKPTKRIATWLKRSEIIQPPATSNQISVDENYFISIREEASKYNELFKENQQLRNSLHKYNPSSVVLWVEWPSDVIHLTSAWHNLYGIDAQLPFFIKNAYSAASVQSSMREENYNETWIALFDFDAAWINAWNWLFSEWGKPKENLEKCISISHDKKHALLLPVPFLLKGQVISNPSFLWITTWVVGESTKVPDFNIISACFEWNPKLDIEHLYYWTFPQLDVYYPKEESHHWWHYFICPERKKLDFLWKIFSKIGKNPEDLLILFQNFRPLFEKIHSLIWHTTV